MSRRFPGNSTEYREYRGVRYRLCGRCSHRRWPWDWYVVGIAEGHANNPNVAIAAAQGAIDGYLSKMVRR